jgi:hypothetical protein
VQNASPFFIPLQPSFGLHYLYFCAILFHSETYSAIFLKISNIYFSSSHHFQAKHIHDGYAAASTLYFILFFTAGGELNKKELLSCLTNQKNISVGPKAKHKAYAGTRKNRPPP